MKDFLISCTAEELEEKIKSGEFDVNASFSEPGIDYKTHEAVTKEVYPLHMVSKLTVEKLQILLKHGADVNAKDSDGLTPIFRTPKYELVKVLIEHGADVNASSNRGNTPLHTKSRPEVIKLLLEHGADVNAKNNEGNTPLHSAGKPEIVKMLLENGADANAKNNEGNTPLHSAGKPEIVKMLLENGADLYAVNNDGQTPQDCATEHIMKYVLGGGVLRDDVITPQPFSKDHNLSEEYLSDDAGDIVKMLLAYDDWAKNKDKIKSEVAEDKFIKLANQAKELKQKISETFSRAIYNCELTQMEDLYFQFIKETSRECRKERKCGSMDFSNDEVKDLLRQAEVTLLSKYVDEKKTELNVNYEDNQNFEERLCKIAHYGPDEALDKGHFYMGTIIENTKKLQKGKYLAVDVDKDVRAYMGLMCSSADEWNSHSLGHVLLYIPIGSKIKAIDYIAKKFPDHDVYHRLHELRSVKETLATWGVKLELPKALSTQKVINEISMSEEEKKLFVEKEIKKNPKAIINGNFTDVDDTLILKGEVLNTRLYEAMQKATAEGQKVYIFTGADVEMQRKRLSALGVDTEKYEIVSKEMFKGCVINGTVIDDLSPEQQGFTTLNGTRKLPQADDLRFDGPAECKEGISVEYYKTLMSTDSHLARIMERKKALEDKKLPKDSEKTVSENGSSSNGGMQTPSNDGGYGR